MGGMGKTKATHKFAHQYKDSYENVAWVNAETKESAIQSFAKIAKALGLPSGAHENIVGKEPAELVYGHLSIHIQKPTLFISDNANRLQKEENVFGIFEFLPKQVTQQLRSFCSRPRRQNGRGMTVKL